jgi:uncharacterized protein (TIGR02246 family)
VSGWKALESLTYLTCFLGDLVMDADEKAIRDLVASWVRASAAGDLDQVLSLMADDVVFLTPGRQPFGKADFATASRANQGKMRFEGNSEVLEVQISGALAYCWTRLKVTVVPLEGGEARRFAGYTLSVLRKQPDGRWVVARDANLLAPETGD